MPQAALFAAGLPKRVTVRLAARAGSLADPRRASSRDGQAKAVAKAIEKHPIVNSSFRTEGTFFNKDINIAMAVAIDGGLITPVLKNANERGVLELGENWKV